MILLLAFSGLIAATSGRVVSLSLSLNNQTDNVFLPPGLLQPKLHFLLKPSNQSGFLNPSLLTPKMAPLVQDRSTTQCGCGYSIVNAAGRIVAGQEVNPMHKLPYQVYVQTCFSRGCAMCGGTLINKRYVITAMHCVKDGSTLASRINVALGEHNIVQDIENNAAQSISVEQIITRDDYNEGTIDNDIAILRLSSDVVFTDNIVPACLPTNPNLDYVGQSATVSGWGTTSEGGSTSDVLKETTVNIVPQNDPTCTPYGANLPNSKMCAYAQGTDSCQGDSGGPLVVMEDGRNTLVGVVSYGTGCARTGLSGVYARVTTYLDWINTNVADGWCDETPVVSPTTTAPVTTAPTTPSAGLGAACDFTCTNVGTVTGLFTLNGIPVSCTSGICSARDGSNVCEVFNYPCGGRPAVEATTTLPTTTTTPKPTTTASTTFLTCSRPCYLGKALANLMTQYQNAELSRNVIVNIGYPGTIRSKCDLETGYCCAADYPSSDLCQRLGWFGTLYG